MTSAAAGAGPRTRSVAVAFAVLLLAAISFWWFPGHTILQSDTQVYIPILQHLENPAVLKQDIMAVRPHVSYTIYDEIALGARRITGAQFETILLVQQFAYRAIGIWGLYLLGTGVGFGIAPALVVAAVCSLGAAVLGPAVLTVEYEPVPRAFALPFLLLSMGLLAHGRSGWSAAAATVGFALHPPTVLAYCGILGGFLVWRREWRPVAVLAIGPLLILATMAGQPPAPEQPSMFARIDPAVERLQRMRAPYNWVSLWIGHWWTHYAILAAALVAAFFRTRDLLPLTLRTVLLALPALGWIALPISYFGLEKMKWALIPQYQPARHLLFVTLFAVMTCTIAAVWAGIRRRYPEAFAFSLIPLLVPMSTHLMHPSAIHLLIAGGLALLLAFGMHGRRTAMAAALLPFLAVPVIGGIRNYADAQSGRLDDLAHWAKSSTAPDAVFQFADAGRQIAPGIFRVRAERALYADWKGGGQINFLFSFGLEWGERWRLGAKPQPLNAYEGKGIDYVVYSAAKAPRDAQPVFRDSEWAVYRVENTTVGKK